MEESISMTIAEVCRRFDLTPDTLRYYEKIGLIPHIERSETKNRSYTEYDCNWIGFIKCMRTAGVQIRQLSRYVQLFQQGEGTAAERKQILEDERTRIAQQIAEMQDTMNRLDAKIQRYEQHIIPAEELLKRPVEGE